MFNELYTREAVKISGNQDYQKKSSTNETWCINDISVTCAQAEYKLQIFLPFLDSIRQDILINTEKEKTVISKCVDEKDTTKLIHSGT